MYKILLVLAAGLSLMQFTKSASADLIFELSDEGGGSTRFTAAGFSGNVLAAPPGGSPGFLDILFPTNTFSDGLQTASSSNLELNGFVFFAPTTNDVPHDLGGNDLLRLAVNPQNTEITPGALTSFSGSFVIPMDFSAFTGPVYSIGYRAITNPQQVGIVTLTSAATGASVPEPSSLLVFAGLGLCAGTATWRRRRKQAAA